MRFLIFLFIFELFFGFNGKWLVLGGVSARHWLFAVVLCAVYGKALYFFVKKVIGKRKQGEKLWQIIVAELSSFSKFDWCLLVFVLLHSIWIVLIPYTQMSIYPNALKESLSSCLCVMFMALYFPGVYLLRNGQVEWKKYRNFVIGCVVTLAMWHVLLYILERIQWQQDHTKYFMERVFDWWENVVHGRCELPTILMPKYAVRIIYGCNVLLLLSFYFVVGQRKKIYLAWLLLGVLALFTTGTRALLVGALAGGVAYLIADGLVHKWNREKIKKVILKTCAVLAFALILDGVCFQGMNVTRLLASFSVSSEVIESGEVEILTWESTEYSAESEIRGTTNSNSTRVLQIKYYISKFLEKPLLGHGFAMQTEIDRDLQGLVYLCKVGVVGILMCLCLFLIFLRKILNMERKEKGSGLPALYLVVAILMDIQFQMMFGVLTMGMALFMFLDLEQKELEIQRRTNEVSDLRVND